MRRVDADNLRAFVREVLSEAVLPKKYVVPTGVGESGLLRDLDKKVPGIAKRLGLKLKPTHSSFNAEHHGGNMGWSYVLLDVKAKDKDSVAKFEAEIAARTADIRQKIKQEKEEKVKDTSAFDKLPKPKASKSLKQPAIVADIGGDAAVAALYDAGSLVSFIDQLGVKNIGLWARLASQDESYLERYIVPMIHGIIGINSTPECEGIWAVDYIRARPAVDGGILYRAGYAMAPGNTLMPDRDHISASASAAWKKAFNKKTITKTPLPPGCDEPAEIAKKEFDPKKHSHLQHAYTLNNTSEFKSLTGTHEALSSEYGEAFQNISDILLAAGEMWMNEIRE